MKDEIFEEYSREKEPTKYYKTYAWKTAIGLQKVDGLEPSEYLIKTAEQHIDGDISFDDAHKLITSYYKENKAKSERAEEADKALATARQVFAAGAVSEDMPTTMLSDADFTDGMINIVDMMIKAKLAPSKGEARRLIQQGGVTLCGEKVTAADVTVSIADFDGKEIIVKKGKKVYHRFARG